MTFHSLADADERAAVDILNQAIGEKRNAYLHPLRGGEAREWFEGLQRSLCVQAVKEGSMLVAWGNLAPYRPGRGALAATAEITFYVHRDHRGKGIGRALLHRLEREARHLGLRYLVGILLDDNRPSRSLLASEGYEVWANFEGIAAFGDGPRGHLYMGKRLRGS